MKNQTMRNHENHPGTMKNQPGTMKNQTGTMKNHENRPGTMTTQPGTMKTDLEVEVEVDLRQLGKVLIFRDRQLLLYI